MPFVVYGTTSKGRLTGPQCFTTAKEAVDRATAWTGEGYKLQAILGPDMRRWPPDKFAELLGDATYAKAAEIETSGRRPSARKARTARQTEPFCRCPSLLKGRQCAFTFSNPGSSRIFARLPAGRRG